MCGTPRHSRAKSWMACYGSAFCLMVRYHKEGYPIMRYIAALLALVAAAFGQNTPSITNITNAAIPAMDFPANSVALAPGSMAIIFGTKLADFTASAPPPWQKAL